LVTINRHFATINRHFAPIIRRGVTNFGRFDGIFLTLDPLNDLDGSIFDRLVGLAEQVGSMSRFAGPVSRGGGEGRKRKWISPLSPCLRVKRLFFAA
jgi:hypothetical protein